ncbi:MAG TPA: V-type ATPase 116kDa subunit family protein [Candidatus Gracilibacteria bacterium]
MAKVNLSKIRIIGLPEHYEMLVTHLQKIGMVQFIPAPNVKPSGELEDEMIASRYDLARIEAALRFLQPYESKRSKIDALLSGGKLVMSPNQAQDRIKAFEPGAEKFLDGVFVAEEQLIRERNELDKLPAIKVICEQLQELNVSFEESFDTEMTRTWIGSVKRGVDKELMKILASETNMVDLKLLSRGTKEVFVRVTALRKFEPFIVGLLESVRFKAFDISLVEEHYGKTVDELSAWYQSEKDRITQNIVALESKVKAFAQETNDLRIFHDYELWHKNKEDLKSGVYKSEVLFAFEGWMPSTEVKSLQEWTQKAFVGKVGLVEATLEDADVPPILMQNKTGIRSFEPVVTMFGLPGKDDFDPTVAVMPFFFIFFGLCLSDVGYGLILTLVSLFFLIFGRFSLGAKHSLGLLFLCGVGATIGGVVLGGYFGLEPGQVPSFLIDQSTGMFKGQLFVPLEGAGPMTFLSLALGLGAMHLLVGVFLEGVKKWMNGDKVGAFLDSWAWFFFLLSLCLFGISSKIEVLDGALWSKMALAGAGILVLTQGRAQKNWLMKPVVGILALYGATSYLSDLLSYARIMALGLATGVVGFAMNLTAGVIYDLIPIPWLGFIGAAIVAVSGHGLNFALSTLGAFIHSGRLQFIEFFGKFYEAGGKPFLPFGKSFKYVFLKNQ